MSEQIETESTQEISSEQAADFARLSAMASDVPPVPGEEVIPQAEAIPLAGQISGMLEMLVNMAGPAFPSLAAIYTQEVIDNVGAALQPVCDKHGWLQDGIGGKYGEEIMALVVVGPLAYATYAGMKSDIQARAPKKRTESVAGPLGAPQMAAPIPDDVPGSNTVTVGAVIQ